MDFLPFTPPMYCLFLHLFFLYLLLSSSAIYFCQQSYVFIQSPWVSFPPTFLVFSKSLKLSHSCSYLPSHSTVWNLFPIRSVLSCLLDFSSPICWMAAAFSAGVELTEARERHTFSSVYIFSSHLLICLYSWNNVSSYLWLWNVYAWMLTVLGQAEYRIIHCTCRPTFHIKSHSIHYSSKAANASSLYTVSLVY